MSSRKKAASSSARTAILVIAFLLVVSAMQHYNLDIFEVLLKVLKGIFGWKATGYVACLVGGLILGRITAKVDFQRLVCPDDDDDDGDDADSDDADGDDVADDADT